MDKKTFNNAVFSNNIEAVIFGLEEHPEWVDKEIQARNNLFKPIHIAAANGYTDLALLLVDRGANINEPALSSEEDMDVLRTPVSFAYIQRKDDTAIALIQRGGMYKPAKPEREAEAFKSFMGFVTGIESFERYDHLESLGAPQYIIKNEIAMKERFNNAVEAIRDHGGKLAKRIPPETLKDGTLNPEFMAFAKALKLAKSLAPGAGADESDKYPLTIDLLDRTKGNWSSIAESLKSFHYGRDVRDFYDAARAFTEVVVLPEFARKTKHLLQAGKVDILEVRAALLNDLIKVIIGDRDISTVLDLQRDWHADRAVLEQAIRDPKFTCKGKWLPLTPDFTAANGLTVSFVTSAAALNTLGEEQNHCVGGYAQQCLTMPTHIGVVKRGEQVLSTFEAQEEPHLKKKIAIKQHRRAGNAGVPKDAPEAEALHEFAQAVHDKEIKINFKKLEAGRMKNAMDAQDVRYMAGFDVFDEKTAPERETNALHQYLKVRTGGRENSVVRRSNSFVPGGEHKWGNKTAKKFLEETGLMKKIDELAANPPLPFDERTQSPVNIDPEVRQGLEQNMREAVQRDPAQAALFERIFGHPPEPPGEQNQR